MFCWGNFGKIMFKRIKSGFGLWVDINFVMNNPLPNRIWQF